jgi:ectoine hydroxylase-related dioxygenase (phytanoyl-CoA dioxygenase family)
MSTATLERSAVLQDYDRDGYFVFRDVLDAELVAEIRDHISWLEQRNPGRNLTEIGAPQLPRDPFWIRVVSDDHLVDIGSLFVGNDIGLFAANYLIKAPRTGKRVEWHQDGPLWPLEPHEVVTLWLAIDESTPENGCLRVVPGSHKRGPLPFEQTGNDDLFGVRVAEAVDEADAIDLPMRPGDVEVHHPDLFHSSNANTSDRRRAGMNIHYIPTTTRITSDEQPYPGGALWLRGAHGANNFNPVPLFDETRDFPFRDWKAWA